MRTQAFGSSYFDGANWAPDTRVPNVAISNSPSAVAFPGGGIAVFHQGVTRTLAGIIGGGDEQLWYSYWDGTNWQPDTLVPNVGMSGSPSAVVFPDGRLSVFHQGSGDSGQLWYTWFDGTNWHPDQQVPNLIAPPAPIMSQSPSAVAWPAPAGAASVFYQGQGDDGSLWYSYWDGTNWALQTQVPNVGVSTSPSCVVV
jgi:hypothetical protein